jgi:hypothetical protein
LCGRICGSLPARQCSVLDGRSAGFQLQEDDCAKPKGAHNAERDRPERIAAGHTGRRVHVEGPV